MAQADIAYRVQVKIRRSPPTFTEDVATISFHLRPGDNVTPFAPGTWTTVGLAIQQFLSSWQIYYHSWNEPFEWRAYLANVAPGTENPPVHIAPITGNVGTATGTNALPPQSAISCTLETAERRRWGRFYMPITLTGTTTVAGRLTTANVDGIAGFLQTFMNNLKTAGNECVPIVYSRPTNVPPELVNTVDPRTGNKIFWSNPHPYTAMDVTGVRVDDVIDTVRRRRWEGSPYRKQLVGVT
jgi:hypothetical protein